MKVFILTRKRLAALCAMLTLAVGVGIAEVSHASNSVAVNANPRSVPIYSVQTDKKQVALSFDAAWGDEQTQSLLDILKKYNVKSTFFLVGDWVRKYPDDVKKIHAAGHDIGNHSDTHPYMTQVDGDSMKKEIETCNSEVKKLIGTAPTLFRPPYGDYNNAVVDTVKGMGMYCVQWSIDSLDWQDPSPSEILQKVVDNLAPGSIILMHNGAKNTPEALPSVIEYIESQGYEIVPISQLIPSGEYTVDPNGTMILTDKSPEKSDTDKTVKTAAEVTSSRNSSGASSVNSAVSSLNSTASANSAKPYNNADSSEMTSSKYTGLAGELYNSVESRRIKD